MASNGEINRLATETGFADKTILVTGITGFLGKVLVEKILRTCPNVKRIYALIRPKKQVIDIQARLQETFDSPLFDLLKKTHGVDILKKIVAINGDIGSPTGNFLDADRALLADEVQIIYHLAATTRFDDSFRTAVLFNARGTQVMLDLAKDCKKLLMFAHCSTAYAHPQERILYERTYPPPQVPEKLIHIVSVLPDLLVDKIANDLLNGLPNAYVYSKALAEGLVNEQMDKLPVVIFRPSVVVPIWRDPLPGWCNSLIGPIGLMVAAGKGILRTMYCNDQTYADFIPADVAVNAMMLATYDFLNFKERRVFNLTSSSQLKITWRELIDVGRIVVTDKMPFNWVVWYPGGSPKNSKWIHNVCSVLLHFIPAIIIDAIIALTGNKPILWRIQRKIARGSELFEFYVNNQWDFNIEKALAGRVLYNKTERAIYKIDEEGLDLEEYLINAIHAARLYVLKESDESLPTARRHIKVMRVVDLIAKVLFFVAIGYVLWKHVVEPILGRKF